MSIPAEEVRVWGWDELTELGRTAYVYNMAHSYLSERGDPIPHEIASDRLQALRAWLEECRSGHPSGVEPGSSATAYLEPESIPPEGRLSEGDVHALADGFDRRWGVMAPDKQQLMLLRMAIAYVAVAYGGMVPAGLVERVLRSARGVTD